MGMRMSNKGSERKGFTIRTYGVFRETQNTYDLIPLRLATTAVLRGVLSGSIDAVHLREGGIGCDCGMGEVQRCAWPPAIQRRVRHRALCALASITQTTSDPRRARPASQ